MDELVRVGEGPLSPESVVAVARRDAPVEFAPGCLTGPVAGSRRMIEALAASEVPHYGVSTGFGALATTHIPPARRTQLQRSLIRSHAAGSGPEVEREVIRAMMLLRLATLATGRTGVRPVVVETYAALINAGLTPVVHEYGSLGCSGDLAPLAHCALALMGEGDVTDAEGVRRPAAVALNEAGLTPVELAAKEGILTGVSGGATFGIAMQLAEKAPEGSVILAMLPDTGERYLSTPLFEAFGAEMNEGELELMRSTPGYQLG